MDNYFEQNVAGERGPRESILYGFCWAALVLMVIVAVISALGIVSPNPERFQIRWMNVILALAAAVAAVLLYIVKDKVYREYDYILWNNELEVCAVYNRRRRKKVVTVPLGKVTAWGPAQAMEGRMHNAKRHNWSVHAGKAWCLLYPGESGTEAAMLELSEEMRVQLRALGHAMREAEVKP